MSKIYNSFAEHYDYLMKDKEYDKESTFINKIFETFIPEKIKTIADMGCGTSTHLLYLKKNYDFKTYGIDLSEKFIALSKTKFYNENLEGEFIQGDDSKISLPEKVNMIICMFSTFNHKLNKEQAFSSLINYYNNLNDGGIVIIDVMNKDHFLSRLDHPCHKKHKTFTTDYTFCNNGIIEITKFYNYEYKEKIHAFEDCFKYYLYDSKEIKNILNEIGFNTLDIYTSFEEHTEGNRDIIIAQKS